MLRFWGFVIVTIGVYQCINSISSAVVYGLPPGFVDEGVSFMNGPNKVVFAPNPRQNGKPMMIVAAKDGVFVAIEDPDNSDEKVLMGNMNSKLCTNGPRGVYSIVPHPDFALNQLIFVWYTNRIVNCPTDPILGPVNRLSRFRINRTTLQLMIETEVVMLETPPSPILLHDGGGMFVGPDRLLYVAIGDGGALPYAQDMRNLYGKLVRLTLTGDVPINNPYTATVGGKGVNCRSNKGRPPPTAPADAVCEEMFAIGLRNPFRIALDPNTNDKVLFAIGDVGNAVWEEISYGGTDYRGTNYGFATYEGICELNSKTACPATHPPGYREPFHWWEHNANGGAVTGVVFVPRTLRWPDRMKFMFIDYVEGKMFNLIADDTVGCRTCIPPRSSFRNETFHRYERMTDVIFGPYRDTQAMYYLSRSEGQNIRRIRYVGTNANPPNAVITLSKNQYLQNEVVQFVGSGSSDPDGGPLTYLWRLDDGVTSTEANPTRSYSQLGTYSISLIVTDNTGITDSAFTTITVGTPPTVNFESPVAGTEFSVGEVLRLRGRGRNSTGGLIPATQLFWEVRQRHANHWHPYFTRRSGNDLNLFPAPPPEDFMAATNSYLQVFLTAVDNNGLSTTIRRDVYPRKVLLDFATNPIGLKVLISDFEVQTPATITAWHNQSLKINAPDQGGLQFTSWTIGGTRERFYRVPPLGPTRPRIAARFG